MRKLLLSKGIFPQSLPCDTLALCSAILLPSPVLAQTVVAPGVAETTTKPSEIAAAILAQADPELRSFYAGRNFKALWIGTDGRPNPAAAALIRLVETAEHDGVDPATIRTAELLAVLKLAELGAPTAQTALAELMLSRAYSDYVNAMRREDSSGQMVYAPEDLKPSPTSASAVLADAASAPALLDYVQGMAWMHPLYAPLRAKVTGGLLDEQTRYVVDANLRRLRMLGAPPAGKHVLVNTASSQLVMYERNLVVGSMRMVVGKPAHATPLMSAAIRYAILKPYWNLPPDYVRKTVAPNVARQGLRYRSLREYEVLSDWGSNPNIINPSTIDWKAVASGTVDVRVRQLPRFGNAMGRVKYELPNRLGIYLHDTPEKHLLLKDERHLSMGCIRLEDAERFGRWLFGAPLPTAELPEQKIDLPQPVPIHIAYVTAVPGADGIVLATDPYSRDGKPATAKALQAALSE